MTVHNKKCVYLIFQICMCIQMVWQYIIKNVYIWFFRFGPYFCQPVIAGLGDDDKPFICTMDSIGAKYGIFSFTLWCLVSFIMCYRLAIVCCFQLKIAQFLSFFSILFLLWRLFYFTLFYFCPIINVTWTHNLKVAIVSAFDYAMGSCHLGDSFVLLCCPRAIL